MNTLKYFLTAALGIGAMNAAQATVYFDQATTINYQINALTILGYNNLNPFTVQIVTGADIEDNCQANNAVSVVMSDGTITGRLITTQNSLAAVSGGTVGYGLLVNDTSRMNVSGGTFGDVETQYNGQADLSGGRVLTYLQATGSSLLTNAGAAVGDYVLTGEQGTVNLRGGSVASYLEADDQSTINLFGGSVGSYLQASSSGIINVYGSNLQLTNATPYNGGTQYTLRGTLQDGTLLNNTAVTFDSGSIVLHNGTAVPSPCALPIFAGGLLAGFWKCRRRVAGLGTA